MRVTQVLRYDAGLYRGGGEIKAERTREALERLGVDVEVFTPHSDRFGDIVHFFGGFTYYWRIAQYCLDQGVPYVCSPIFVTPRSPRRLKWRALRQKFLELKGENNHQKLYRHARELYFQTEFERRNAVAYFGPKIARQIIVPNGVESRFASGDAELFRGHLGIKGPFVLQASVFNPNKHQLELIRAMRGMDIPLVLIGGTPNMEYFEACKKAAGPNVHFLERIPHQDPLLPAAYAAASVFCLASSDDIFANSAMEAAVAGCRLVLGDTWGGQEIYGKWATWVKPGDTTAIRSAIERLFGGNHDSAAQSEYFLSRYSWDEVAKQLKSCYENTLATRR